MKSGSHGRTDNLKTTTDNFIGFHNQFNISEHGL